MKTLSLSTLIFLVFHLQAQQLKGPVANGMGGTAVASGNAYSLFNNQAGLAEVQTATAVAIMERRFLLRDFDVAGAGIVFPAKSGVFGLQLQHSGFDVYRRQKAGLAYARKLWQSLRVAGQFEYYRTQIETYGSRGTVTFEAGLQTDISGTLSVGMHVSNPGQPELTAREVLPTTIRFGGLYSPSDKASLAFELEKDIDFPLQIRAGFEYKATEKVILRSGFTTSLPTFHLGFGFLLKSSLQLDVSTTYHQTLGLTPSLGVRYDFAYKSNSAAFQ